MLADTECEDLECTGYFKGTADSTEWNNNMEALVKKYFKSAKISKYGDNSLIEHTASLTGTPRPDIFTE